MERIPALDRHDLVYLTPRGREQALRHADGEAQRVFESELLERITEQCPGIVMRQGFSEAQHSYLRLGFSWYERRDGVRMRFATMTDRAEVLRVEKPWELMQYVERLHDERLRRMLYSIRDAGDRYGIRWGIFGSCALELATGLPYTDEHSDLDLIAVREEKDDRGCSVSVGMNCPDANLYSFYKECCDITGDTRPDMEILIPGTGSVKAAEWFLQSETVLVKSLDGARLAERREL